jgi:uncharacterized protein DUF4190/uncharacterized protein DUF2510
VNHGSLPPAGYYPDPDQPRVQRWWDGHAWALPPTGTVRTAPPPIVPTPAAVTNQYAIASLVLSISWIFFIGSVLGVILGHVAMAQIRASEGREIGRGSAMIGLIVGYVGIASGLLLALIVAG